MMAIILVSIAPISNLHIIFTPRRRDSPCRGTILFIEPRYRLSSASTRTMQAFMGKLLFVSMFSLIIAINAWRLDNRFRA